VKLSEIGAAHEHSIRQLLEEFGEHNANLIEATYYEQKKKLEQEATVLVFVPLLACNAARKALQKQDHPLYESSKNALII
jgi:hypothetical protein